MMGSLPSSSAVSSQWTSWRLLKLASSHPNEWRYGAGAEADSGAGRGGSGLISFLLFSVLVYLVAFICQRG